MARPSRTRLAEVIELACLAPSVHNTQPWLWRIVGQSTIELYADRSRQLLVADPDGRNLAISCGAALQHVSEAARAKGMAATIVLTPEASDHDLLARVHLTEGTPASDAAERLATMQRRCTDRRRFTAWPVPDARLHKLAEVASGWGAYAVPITDVSARFRTELLLDRAMTLQAADPRFAAEQRRWIEHSRTDGIPTSRAVPPASPRRERPNRFAADSAAPPPPQTHRVVESSDGLIAVCTADDDQGAWLQAGETLSALWLWATQAGLSIVPLSQATEVAETREALRNEVFGGMARTQILVRVGWQEIARTTLPRTPRRPLEDVLLG